MRSRAALAVFLAMFVVAGFATAQEPSTGAWQFESRASAGGRRITLTRIARQPVRGWQREGRPVLAIACAAGEATVELDLGVPLEVTQVDQQIVRVRFDQADFRPERWRETGNSTIASRHPRALLNVLASARSFTLEFTPFSSAPARAEFGLEGLERYAKEIAAECGSTKDAGDPRR